MKTAGSSWQGACTDSYSTKARSPCRKPVSVPSTPTWKPEYLTQPSTATHNSKRASAKGRPICQQYFAQLPVQRLGCNSIRCVLVRRFSLRPRQCGVFASLSCLDSANLLRCQDCQELNFTPDVVCFHSLWSRHAKLFYGKNEYDCKKGRDSIEIDMVVNPESRKQGHYQCRS